MDITKMQIGNDGKIVEETLIIDIVINDKTEKIILRKLSSGVQGKIRSDCTKTRILAGQPKVDIDDATYESSLLQAVIVEAPFPHDLNGVKALPSEVGVYILRKWSEVANIS